MLKIGGTGPLTGGASIYGISVKQGAEIAVEEINAANPYRLDFLLPATLMKQLFTVATKLQFR